MSLLSKFPRDFPRSVVERGRDYFARGRVRVDYADEGEVNATVRGTTRYDVVLRREGTSLVVECTCAHFEEHAHGCKHIAATILEAERQRFAVLAGDVQSIDCDVDDDDWDDEADEYGEYDADGNYLTAPPEPSRLRSYEPVRPAWEVQLDAISKLIEDESRGPATWPTPRELLYVVEAAMSTDNLGISIELMGREKLKGGEWGQAKSLSIAYGSIARLPDPADRAIVAQLAGGRSEYELSGWAQTHNYNVMSPRRRLLPPLAALLLPQMCATGRCYLRARQLGADPAPIVWDHGPPWELWVEVRSKWQGGYSIAGVLRRGDARRSLGEPILMTEGGLVFDRDRVARLDHGGAFALIKLFQWKPVEVDDDEVFRLVGRLAETPIAPRLLLPEELKFERVVERPRPRLTLRAPSRDTLGSSRLLGELAFVYGDAVVDGRRPGLYVFDGERRRLVERDERIEADAVARLVEVGVKPPPPFNADAPWELAPKRLPGVVRQLLAEGWLVEAEGKLYRKPGEIKIEVSSGLDWFDLHAQVDFGGATATLPALLAALKRGEATVLLDDGTLGLLPEEWLRKNGLVAATGEVQGDALRFKRNQVGLLDALLAAQPEAAVDEVFERARAELQRFDGVRAADPPPGFVGELRGYQREGLGWLQFLQGFGFGGCLADDMGLGKTVQVLALLESRRRTNGTAEAQPAARPSLVVVPKSLVFNWKLEAERFAPGLSILDHTGPGRARSGEAFDDFDLVLTTYGTLRRDAMLFKDVEFDYVVLDEAQAIKNASTESAKAARLLRASHRLALSGTPIENHIGELWSLFEFLNPGLLGAASVFRIVSGGDGATPESRALLARAVRPFILRRTKDQVAKELPPKSEQTIYCELDSAQRKLYDELLAHYRASLLGKIEREGITRSKIQVLEALLRLRQAACHPGLIDEARRKESSAKLDVLVEQLEEVLDEGHKALVFSQFTSLLSIVRDRLDRKKIAYEYLDGRTRDRAARVERFQTDPECKLFLISLKAGGLGLNLTEAEYVFLLDPWWNPAVEAQAIDRAHRIGQTRPVFAYRLIARGTVEEKVLELQASKRELAESIIRADESLIRTLTRDDLALLLS